MSTLDKHKISLAEVIDINWLKQNYFSDKRQRLVLRKGDKVTRQGIVNIKLFYVASGSLSGYFKTEDGTVINMFSAGINMIVGIYSFFSNEHCSYTTVIAEEDSVVFYTTNNQLPQKGTAEYGLFIQQILPVVVNEIYLRQMVTINSLTEKEAAIEKLFDQDKMATLGQMAAGLAHELNNAISVIQSKVDWVSRNLKYYISEKDSRGLYPYFLRSLENGQSKSSIEIRKKRKEIIKKFDLKENRARRLARMDLSIEEIKGVLDKQDKEVLDRLDYYWEAGLALHDIHIATDHTTHVIKSIKELGARNRDEINEFNLLASVKKTQSILSNLIRDIDVETDISEGLFINGKEGDFIQLWMNLIKNAAESLMATDSELRKITISAKQKNENVRVMISDNGPGIPEKNLVKIFQPSFTTKIDGLSFGLGLGLSIVQKIVSMYNGSIDVRSSPHQTSFIVEIPKE